MDTRLCASCGGVFTPRSIRSLYCQDCKNKFRKQSMKGRTCMWCGKLYDAKTPNQRYCSTECREDSVENQRRQQIPKVKGATGTTCTKYLCHKWRREGYRPMEIAKLLNRSLQTVLVALQEPLSKRQELMLREYLNPRMEARHVQGDI